MVVQLARRRSMQTQSAHRGSTFVSPNAFIRGCEGLKEQIESIRIKTAGQIDYIGEWHSHPGDSTAASEDDRVLFAWLKEYRQLDGLPALMAICAGRTSRWFVADIDQNGELAHE